MTATQPTPDSVHARLDEAVRFGLREAEGHRFAMRVVPLAPRALVLDANVLRGEIGGLVRRGHDTALVTLAKIGMLSLHAATHVLEEVEEHTERWSGEMGLSATEYRTTWRTVLAPLILPVKFGDELLTTREQARIDHLNQPAPLGDPDDVPTAIASLMLEAPVLSRDVKLLRAVYGDDFDADLPGSYVDALFGGGRVLVVSELGWASLAAARLACLAVTSGVRLVTAQTGVVALGLAAGAGALGVASSPSLRARLQGLGPPALAAYSFLLELATFYAEAERAFNSLTTPPRWDEDELTAAEATRRRTARNAALAVAARVASEQP